MRNIIEKQLKFGQVDIPNIEIDFKSRDEIPQLLLGLQTIYADKKLREKVFSILKHIIPVNINTKTGRPGMDLWKILVLGTVKLNCKFDYDKLHDISNNHMKIREFLGHTAQDFHKTYSLQALKDNLRLFTPEILEKINYQVILAGHKFLSNEDSIEINGRCDSFVVETNVHYPTDINLLFDAIRKTMELTARVCAECGITQWRQYRHIIRKIKKQFNKVQRLKRSTSKNKTKKALKEQEIIKAHSQYIDLVEDYLEDAKFSLQVADDMEITDFTTILLVENYIVHAERQIDQIRRRILNGEKIPHSEKVFSIFEEHSEWISKGKAGKPVELGLRVCVLTDQFGFVLNHRVMEKETDDKVAIPMVKTTKEKYPNFKGCSFDKGFYSPDNKKTLTKYITNVILPKKGRLAKKDKEVEKSEKFIQYRRKHSAIESSINALENHGLDRCLDHGIHGFKRYVAMSVLSRNIQILGSLIRKRELKRLKRIENAARKRYASAV